MTTNKSEHGVIRTFDSPEDARRHAEERSQKLFNVSFAEAQARLASGAWSGTPAEFEVRGLEALIRGR